MNEPMPEDMTRDLAADLGWLQYLHGEMFTGQIQAIALAACRCVIAAERAVRTLEDQLDERIEFGSKAMQDRDAAERERDALKATLSSNTLATDLLHAERQIESLQTELADARKGAEVAVALVRAELAEAVRLLQDEVRGKLQIHSSVAAFLAKQEGNK